LFSFKQSNPTKPIFEGNHPDQNSDVPSLKPLMTMILNFKGEYEVRGIERRLRGGMM
jgi:hypothetical protein